MAAALQCGKCQTAIPGGYFNLDHLTPCPKCSSDLQVFAFPAMFRRVEHAGPVAAEESDAACFYHLDNRAAAECASCGRFLCTVCEVEIGGEVLCPGCIHAGVTSRKLVRLENRRVLHDNITLAVALVPMLLISPTIISAPMTIFLALRFWKSPLSIVKRSKIRFVLAIVIAMVQIAFWAFVIYMAFMARGVK
ncbi:MAG TPA: hypothetical protein VER03_25435 [Bryobacteraceae bacterium]|nr:hypothetical protein [Bryobacteraceae bacterium]